MTKDVWALWITNHRTEVGGNELGVYRRTPSCVVAITDDEDVVNWWQSVPERGVTRSAEKVPFVGLNDGLIQLLDVIPD